MTSNFQGFDQIFGEAIPETEGSGPTTTNPSGNTNPSFVFRIFAADPHHLRFHVTDFLSSSWSSSLSLLQFDDLRDSIGIGGSWSDFVDYVTSSFKSKHVKLLLPSSHSHSNGGKSAKLVARKSKGMPLVSIALSKLENSAASEVIASMSLELFKAYSLLRDSVTKEQENSCQLPRGISAEKGNDQHVKRKLDAYTHTENQGLPRTSDPVNMNSFKSDNSSIATSLNSSDKQATNEVQPSKAACRVAPAHRRAKVRGAVLQDSED